MLYVVWRYNGKACDLFIKNLKGEREGRLLF